MTTFLKDGFRDINPDLFKTHPLQVVRAASLTAALVERYQDSGDRPGAIREVFYFDRTAPGYQAKLTLQLITVPQQLTTLTSASLTTTSGSPEGRLMFADGSFGAGAAASLYNVYGWCFDSYYEFVQNRHSTDAAVTQLEAGDWIWVVVKASAYEIKAGEAGGGAIVAGNTLVTDADATHSEGGRVRASATIGDTSAGDESGNIAESDSDIILGVALAAPAAENDLFFAKLDIEGYNRPVWQTTV